jgi:hypothetical protein
MAGYSNLHASCLQSVNLFTGSHLVEILRVLSDGNEKFSVSWDASNLDRDNRHCILLFVFRTLPL